MRTTVEISDEQHRALSAMAQQRGLRGFSLLVQEAVQAYLDDQDDEEIAALLALRGSIDDEEEAEMRARVQTARSMWRTP